MYKLNLIYSALRLYYNKKNNKLRVSDIISSFGFSKSRFYDWVKMYPRDIVFGCNIKEIDKIQKQHIKYKRVVTDEIDEYIVQCKTVNPIANNKKIRNEIKEKFNTIISRSNYFRVLKCHNFTNKRIQKNKYPYIDENLKIQKETLKKSLIEYKRNVVSIDEMSVVIGEKPNYGMSIKGKRCYLKVTNIRKRYSVVIAISRK